MEAFKVTKLTPISVHPEKSTNPRKLSSFSLPKHPKIKPTPLNGCPVVLSSVIGSDFARALTYEESLEQSKLITAGGVLDEIVKFGTDNLAFIIGGATLVAVPLVLSKVLKNPKSWGVESAKNAYTKLGEDASAQLIDIRTPKEFREVGTPNISGLRKKAVSIVYKGEDKPGFLKKLGLKFKEPENTTLFILDKFDGNSELVAELVAVNGFKTAYAIKDGVEGSRGWMNSGLPWIPPKKTLGLDLGRLSDAFSGALDGGSDALPVTLGVMVATGIGLLAFTEIETLLQLLGSAALVQFVSKKLLFAQDRKETLQVVNEFVNDKIALKELVGDVKQIGKAFLPISQDKKALPSPTKAVHEVNTDSKTDARAESNQANNSVPKGEVEKEALPRPSRPLSPYPNYPDFRPPASPCPSPP